MQEVSEKGYNPEEVALNAKNMNTILLLRWTESSNIIGPPQWTEQVLQKMRGIYENGK